MLMRRDADKKGGKPKKKKDVRNGGDYGGARR
jgi:hypothetical protein